jgi:ribosomal protein L11 methyltransferase
MEDDEGRLDSRLAAISRQLSGPDDHPVSREDIRIRVRNLAYSEPYTGSGEFSEPFKPIPSLTVRPCQPGLKEVEDSRSIILDCPHTFGTGKHPTTLLCLRFLEQMANSDRSGFGLQGLRVLDFGCGTGILAVAALKMGAAGAVGVEIDPDAAKAAKRNVSLNQLDDVIEIREGSWEATVGRFDLILANVVTGVLLKVGTEIPAHLKPGGPAIVSGFSEKQEREIRRLFEGCGMMVIKKAVERDWCAFLLI